MTGTALSRIRDLVVGLVVLPLALPLMAVLAGLVLVSSGRPVLYRATRMGRFASPFTMYKFRTMTASSDGPAITSGADARITRVGRWLRRTKLDELPQLWNLLRGDMSLVGPRPEDPKFVTYYTTEERRVLSVRPGITGPATVDFRDEERLLVNVPADEVEAYYVTELLHRKLAVDLAYLDRRTFTGDLAILVRTLPLHRSRRTAA